MTHLINLSEEDRMLVEDACAAYMAHHHPQIFTAADTALHKMKQAGAPEYEVREVERRFWDEIALQKLSPALGVTVLERGVVLRRPGVVVTLVENEGGGVEVSIAKEEDLR